MEQAGFQGHYTNHSLRVTAATRLFDAQIDEQLIDEQLNMNRTGHSSLVSPGRFVSRSIRLQNKITLGRLLGLVLIVSARGYNQIYKSREYLLFVSGCSPARHLVHSFAIATPIYN